MNCKICRAGLETDYKYFDVDNHRICSRCFLKTLGGFK